MTGTTPIEARPAIDHEVFAVCEPAGHAITFFSTPQQDTMHPRLQAAFDMELKAANEALAGDDLESAFAHFERAHVLGQWYVRTHTLAHIGLLRIGWRRRDLREIVGQLLRLPGGMLGSALGRVPRGNTGGANVSAFREMPIPPELRSLLVLDERSRLG